MRGGPSQPLSAFRGLRRRIRAHFSRRAASPQSLNQSGSDSNNGAGAYTNAAVPSRQRCTELAARITRQGTSTIAVRGATGIVGPETVLPERRSVSVALGNPLTFCGASLRLIAT